MTEYTYKCVAVPSVINTGKPGRDQHEKAVIAYEKLINEGANGGWELINIDTVTSTQNAGCLAALVGKKDQQITFKMLVFKKPK